jgi:hypothetical protein
VACRAFPFGFLHDPSPDWDCAGEKASFLQQIARKMMSLKPTDKQGSSRKDDAAAKPPYSPLELKKLSPKDALKWLESKSSSSDRATSEQIEELEQYVRALIPGENG